MLRIVPRPLAVWGMRWTILLALTAVALQETASHKLIWVFMICAALADLAIMLMGEVRLARRQAQSRILLGELKTRLGDEHIGGNQ
jgi:hypothetical protein